MVIVCRVCMFCYQRNAAAYCAYIGGANWFKTLNSPVCATFLHVFLDKMHLRLITPAFFLWFYSM